ncbi:MAG: hypothetical protein EKK31_34995 [Hyphomicrobiales bacterium]|nr:MAG: hypothetical protein EKK31_34995 [Hyphomicrobiales bacterium]
MPKLTSSRFFWLAMRASTALAFAVAPYHLTSDTAAKIGPAAAYAKGGDGGGGGGEGHGGNSGSGGGSGSSGSSGPGGNSGPGGGDDGGNSGSGGDDGGNSGSGGDDGPGDDHGADSAADHDQDHVNQLTGDKVEVAGNNIEVTHPDGTKEEIENGRFEQKDATGQTIVERPATPEDVARLQGL